MAGGFSISTVFSWLKKKSESTNNTKSGITRPATQFNFDDQVVNIGLCDGLYNNTYPGMKLASGLAYIAIAVPVWFMGLPTVKPAVESLQVQALIDQVYDLMYQRMQQLHTVCHRRGTVWIWPKYDAIKRVPIWEDLPDDIVTDILRDPYTNEIVEIYTNREFEVAIGEDQRRTIAEKKHYTASIITTTYTGEAVPGYENYQTVNPIGITPINFTNNSDPDDARGHSDYERILQYLKQYHDIDLAESEVLAKFRGKLIQYVQNLDDWLAQNGIGDLEDFEPESIDLIINLVDKEKTEYLFPKDAVDGYEKALKRIFRKIVEAIGVPEISWGLKTEGNNASVEESMGVLVNNAKAKQTQHTKNYITLWNATIRMMSRANMMREAPKVEVTWGDLSAVNEQTKAVIWKSYAEGLAAVMNVAGMTTQQIHTFWLQRFPEGTPEEFAEFEAQMMKAAAYKAYSTATYLEQKTGNGSGNLTDDEIV